MESADSQLGQAEELYKCSSDEPFPSKFTSILAVGRIFQLAFAIPGQLKPCVLVSAADHTTEADEPAATIGGKVFVEHLPGSTEKCMYVLRKYQSEDWEALIVFDRLSAEYTVGPNALGDVVLDVRGKDRAVCTQFHDQRVFRGHYPTTGAGACFSKLEIGGPVYINTAIRALRYIFSNVCPHLELRPY